jgi:GNAT acetyltransferase-like protein
VGVQFGAQAGEPVFGELWRDDEVIGIAAGVRTRCAISRRARHFYFPALPALICRSRHQGALRALMERLTHEHAVEAVFDPFDSVWQPGRAVPGRRGDGRVEHVVPLESAGADDLLARVSDHHRSFIRKGDRSEWTVRPLAGRNAVAMWQVVQFAKVAQQPPPGSEFTPPPLDSAWSDPWGVRMLTAWRDRDPLAAAVVGWAGGRAFYLMGGPTAEGYRQGAQIWLQWQIMCQLAALGFKSYNLSGLPPGDPPRWTEGFGADAVHCAGVSWTLGRAHIGTHRLAEWVRQHFGARASR